MWTTKYAPQSLSEMVGNSDVLTEIRLWAQAWKQGQPPKPLLLVGPPGVGKTLSAYVLAREFGWSIVEFNASDARNKEFVEKGVSAAALNASFTGELRLVLLDEVDGIHGKDDKGGMPAILSVLKEARNPIILTANDIYGDKSLAGIRTFCKLLSFKKVSYPTIGKYLREICEKEKVDYDAISITELAKNSSGDLRAAVLDLEMLTSSTKKVTLEDVQSSGYRERQENVFNALRTVFVSPSLGEIRRTRSNVEVDHDLFKKWIDENIPRQFPMQPSLAQAYNSLSRGDVFDGRIYRRQHYGFLKYSGDLVAAVGLSTNERAHGFISYQFPTILKRLSMMKGSSKRSVIEKIQTHVYGSRARITQELVFYAALLEDEKNAAHWVSLFEFDEDDIAFLLQTTPSSVKVKRLIEAAESLRSHPTAKKIGKETHASNPIPPSRRKAPVPESISTDSNIPAPELSDDDKKNQTSLSKFFG